MAQMDERTRSIQEAQIQLQTNVSEHLMKSFDILRGQLVETITQNAKQTDKQVALLTQQTEQRLKEISGQVEKRLFEGFEKTNATFLDVVKRLALIDEAQKKITELSSNVVSLQAILSDKRSRGAFGEVQLSALVSNVLPEQHYSLQHTFSTGTRVDCVLFLPEPTGNIAIDSKFPLESYRTMTDIQVAETDRQAAARQFKQDIKKHVQDVADKYIVSNETADGAILFIPAEAIFAEIHGHHPELVEEAYKRKVWLASPTTLMAILTTIRAVIKDDATRKQVHIIQEHLAGLGEDFKRFQMRMDKLADHIRQANDDVTAVNTSAKKITSRFSKIEQVELHSDVEPLNALELPTD
ncbi:MAG: DNA recombination protein RmuC [Gammaproteobacteria bacterium]|nr:DNA recombination protein RmuC [Gammaproteobacteria bacterium]